MNPRTLIESAKARAEIAVAERKPFYEIAEGLKELAAAVREIAAALKERKEKLDMQDFTQITDIEGFTPLR